MALHPAEEATLTSFVISAKRDRAIALLGSAKRRKQALDSLNHFDAWDPRWAETIPSSANLLTVLKKAGSPTSCHVISDNPSIDGQDMPLEDAIQAAESQSFASVLCCIPGQLALYIDELEAPRRCLLLRKPPVNANAANKAR
jgi:hypothetical protein